MPNEAEHLSMCHFFIGEDVQIFSPLDSGISCCSEGSSMSGIQIFYQIHDLQIFSPKEMVGFSVLVSNAVL